MSSAGGRVLVFSVVLGLASVGCVREGPPPRQPPIELPEQPRVLSVDRLVVFASNLPDDSDANGYYDTIPVTVYLYSDRYPIPIVDDGTLTFTLLTEARVLRRWVFDPEAMRSSVGRAGPGPAYVFELSMLEGGTDRLPVGEAELRWRYEAPDRPPLQGRGSTVLVGPVTVGQR